MISPCASVAQLQPSGFLPMTGIVSFGPQGERQRVDGLECGDGGEVSGGLPEHRSPMDRRTGARDVWGNAVAVVVMSATWNLDGFAGALVALIAMLITLRSARRALQMHRLPARTECFAHVREWARDVVAVMSESVVACDFDPKRAPDLFAFRRTGQAMEGARDARQKPV